MSASEKVINSLLNIFRGSGLVRHKSWEVSLTLLALAKLTWNGVIPPEIGFTENVLLIDSEALQQRLNRLSELESLGESRKAFVSSFVGSVSDAPLSSALQLVSEVAASGVLNHFDLTEFLYQELSRDTRLMLVPDEVIKLMVNFAGELSGKRIYTPFDPFCRLAHEAESAGGEVYVENPIISSIPWLIKILTDAKYHLAVSDPLRQPAYAKSGKLEKFDISISFPPIGHRYEFDVVEQDWFGRFKERTTSGAVLSIQHILSQTTEKAVIAIPNGTLFSSGAERSLREDLLESQVIRGVVTMPPALLPSTVIPFSILLIDMQNLTNTIRFVDGSNERFFERDGRNRSRLTNWQALQEAFYEESDETVAVTVPVDQIRKSDAHLEANRYILLPERKDAEALLRKADAIKKLESCVEFIRPLHKHSDEGDLLVREVTLSDFPEFGCLSVPERTVKLSKGWLKGKESTTFLRPHDIVIAVKGSAGKLAIAPDAVPEAGEGGWVVNQSCLILRTMGQLPPKVLFVYLSSDLGQALLKRIISGATIPLIQLKMLKELQVIIPSKERANSIVITFNTQVDLQKRIEELYQEQLRLGKAHWSL